MARRQRLHGTSLRMDSPDGLPPSLATPEILKASHEHMQANKHCWACGEPSSMIVTAVTRARNVRGGNITFYSLCEPCSSSQRVMEQIDRDLDQDAARAESMRNN